MMAHGSLDSLAMVLCVAALTTVIFNYLRQPVVIGYILAGLIVGPYLAVPLTADRETIQTMAELGVVLLMFTIGLDFSFKRLKEVLPTGGTVALVETSLLVWLGYAVGRQLGWGVRESLLAGGIVSISSTTVVAKIFSEKGERGPETETVLGILLVEDIIAILLLGVFATLTKGGGFSFEHLVENAGWLAAFLAATVVMGVMLIPRSIRAVERTARSETLLVASVGLCFAAALLARNAGFSVALGAFLAGVLVTESGAGWRVKELVRPLRDLFAAVFFVAIGMSIDPKLAASHWPVALLFSAVVVGGKFIGVSGGAFLTGRSPGVAVRAGMSMGQIGEFSFLMAGLGAMRGGSGAKLYTLAVSVSAFTILLTPWMHRLAPRVAAWVDRQMPPRLQTFVTMYGAWLERLPEAWKQRVPKSRFLKLLRMTLLDGFLLVATVAVASQYIGWMAGKGADLTGAPAWVAQFAVGGLASALALFFLFGIVRGARAMGDILLEAVMPTPGPERADFSTVPRQVLQEAFRAAAVLLAGIPLVAATQPFLSFIPGAVMLGGALAVPVYFIWRRTADLHGHVKAGAKLVMEILQGQLHESGTGPVDSREEIPGIGKVATFRVEAWHHAAGRNLSALDLRAQTGANIIAIRRGEEKLEFPTGSAVLHEGDILVLAGSLDAVSQAHAVLSE
jgi:CPA2 family monovalent cation:H+ antiporter-2